MFKELYDKTLINIHESRKSEKKQDTAVIVLKYLAGAAGVFTFLAGIVFTVIPLIKNISYHIELHVLEPLHEWMLAQPTTGSALVFLFYATVASIVLYILRDLLYLLFLNFMCFVEMIWEAVKKKWNSFEIKS